MVLLDWSSLEVALHWPMLPKGWMLLEFLDCFVGKTLSAPCNSVLCELLHPSVRLFLGWGHWRNVCLSRKHEKQSFLSATKLALWVWVFSLKTRNSISGGYLLPTMQREEVFVEVEGICFFVYPCCQFDVNTLEAVLVLVTEVLFSSGFAFMALCFIRSWASAFSLGHR